LGVGQFDHKTIFRKIVKKVSLGEIRV